MEQKFKIDTNSTEIEIQRKKNFRCQLEYFSIVNNFKNQPTMFHS